MSNSQFYIKLVFDQKMVLFDNFWHFFDQKRIKMTIFWAFLGFFDDIYILRIIKFLKLIFTI
tara:strand:+ start:53 stop:238 length:186 start_codon:yes stop_codon:yes gene_type:complete